MTPSKPPAIPGERIRAGSMARALDGWWDDLRLAIRGLSRSRAFSVVTILTLSLGIGVNASIFTVVNAVLLRPLPYPAGPRLVRLWETLPPAPGSNPDARPRRSSRIT